ncbi:MAG: hypothetical protein APR54_11920 [Candidatus Cloacimonas sp. SDB]|nr:MAG: hypothetical protein APR54_11920 [Candidatus Cloacimonas sp. SDB]
MSIVKNILRDEKNRLVLLKDQIEEQILSLPKGSLSRKKRSNRFYCYLAYRKGDKVIFKYLGKDNSPEIASLEKDIKKRRKLEKRLREIKADLKDIKRGLGER